ncbi:hypothetical protein, partial [uncultured Thiodictyon sp.]|uniref:hypothetical protein n=1 Tax=uncultured Thiodictyon sp. TaxID=1846217 RepID=UPI0025D91C89
MSVENDAALAHLIGALALGDGFQFHIVVCHSPRQVRQLLGTLAVDVPARRGGTVRSEHLIPAAQALPSDRPLDGDALSVLVNDRLSGLAPTSADERVVFALDASFPGTADQPAWRQLFRRMNEQRNALARGLDGVLLLCLSPRLAAVFAQEAPDFWSVRGVSVTLEPELTHARDGGSQGLVFAQEPGRDAAGADGQDRDTLEAEVAAARTQAADRPDDRGTQRILFILLVRLGDQLINLARSQEAVAAYREASGIA